MITNNLLYYCFSLFSDGSNQIVTSLHLDRSYESHSITISWRLLWKENIRKSKVRFVY